MRSHFLVESLATVALYLDEKVEGKDREKVAAKHAWFVQLLRQATQEAPYLEAAAHLLNDASGLKHIQAELKQAKAKATDTAVVIVNEINPLLRDDWRDWWRQFRTRLHPVGAGGGRLMRCILTGEMIKPVATHPKIKGLAGIGGLGTGDVLAGFDKAAFQSYGLEQAANAAMSEATATAYTATLNRLIADKSIKLGNMLATYWFTGQNEITADEEVMAWFYEPPEQTAGAAERRASMLLTAIRTGKRPDLAGNRFVSLLMSGAAGRVMVREVMQGSFEELVAHSEAWFHDLAIVAHGGGDLAHDPKFLVVAGSLVHELKDIPGPCLHQLWRAAVTGGLLPRAVLAQAIARARIDFIKAEGSRNPRERALRIAQRQTRMALLKAYLIRDQGDTDMRPLVNPEHPHPAYHCGRALALFARLQRVALGDVGAGVVQRFYIATSQAPGLILGRLASNAKNHLAKLSVGRAWWFEDQLAGIMSSIGDAVPRTLTLEEQSLFALGYYQQLAALNVRKQTPPEPNESE